MIYAIDFDGTIVENKFPKIGKLIPETADFIHTLKSRGHTWILWTMREENHLTEALELLTVNDLLPDYVNDNVPELKKSFGNNPRKVYADVYIDDHNAGGIEMLKRWMYADGTWEMPTAESEAESEADK